MAKRPDRPPVRTPQLTPIEQIMDTGDASLLDLLDRVLAKGVMASGDLTLGVAGIDLIYVRLSALLGAADRVLPRPAPSGGSRTRRRHAGAPGARRGRRS
jgi:hypothetical protein